MAKKNKVRWDDLFADNKAPSWAAQERADFLNKDKQYNAIIDTYQNEAGVEFDAATRLSMLKELRSGKPLNFAQSPEEETPAPVLPSPKKPTPAKAAGLWDTIQEGVVSLIGRADAARESGNAASATVDLVNKDPSVMRGGLLARLADIKAGKATKSVPIFTGMQGEYDTEEVPLSPKEAEREAAGIQRRLADIDKQVVGAEYKAEMDRLRAEKKASTERAGVATEVAKGAESKLPASVARATRVVGSNLTAEQAISTVAPIAAAVVTRSPAATAAVSALANIPQAKASFANAFQTAIEKHGATQEEATAYAGAVTAIEFGSETVGGALGGAATAGFSFLKSLGGKATKEAAEAALEKTIKSRVSRFATGQALDAAGEAASVLGQRFLDTSLEGTDYGSEKGQAALKQANEDFSYVESLTDAVIGSVGVGGVPGAIGAQTSYKADVKAQNERTVSDILTGDKNAAATAEQQYQDDVKVVQDAKTAYEDGLRRAAESQTQRDAATEAAGMQTAEEQAAAKEAQKGFNSIPAVSKGGRVLDRPIDPEAELAANERLAAPVAKETKAVDKARAAMIGAPRTDTTEGADRPQTPGTENFEAFAAREAARMERENAEREAKQKREAAEAEASSRLEEAKRRITLEEKRKARDAKTAETARRNNLAKQVARQHADKTPQEQARILADLIAEPTAKADPAKKKEKSPEERVQGVINQVEGLRKQKVTARVNNRIRSLYRQDPNRSAKDIADILAKEEGTAPATEEQAPTEAELKTKVEALNKSGDLDMAGTVDAASTREQEDIQIGQSPVRKRTAEEQANYTKRVTDFVKALPNTNEGVAIRNLIKQGKVIITDRGASIGMKDSPAAGSYIPSKGKVVVRLNNLDPKLPKASILAAVVAHEAGHVGQFNQRDGRSALFKHLLGDKGSAAANQQIRDLAKAGNKLAQATVAKAKKAAELNKTVDNVENIELVPYLFTLAKHGEHSPGRLGKVIRDVKVAARQANRKLLNKDLDFSLDEIVAAGDKVAEEIVNTDVRPEAIDGEADMVMGDNAADAKKAVRRYKGAVDGLNRWVLSDRNADTTAEAGQRLRNGETLKLKDVLKHDALYKNYPALENYNVIVDPSLKGFGAAIFRQDKKEIGLSPESAARFEDAEIRKTMLHETQHAVQGLEGFVSGNSAKYIADPMFKNDLDTANERLDKALDRFDLGTWKKTTPAQFVKAVERALPSDAIREQSEYVLRNGLEKESSDRLVKQYGDNVYSKLRTAQNQATAAYNNEQYRAWNIYLRDYGEAEARTTEYASNMTQEELDNTNFEGMFKEAEHPVPVNETLDSGGYYRGRRPSGKDALDMAAPGRFDMPEKNGNVDARGADLTSMSDQELAREWNRLYSDMDWRKRNTPEAKAARQPIIAEMNRRHAQGSLDMAAPERKPDTKFSVKERITRILSHGRQDRLDVSKTAEDLHSQMVDAIKDDTGQSVLTDEMDREFNEFLTHPDQGSVQGRARLIANLSAKYPQTTGVLVQMRDLISDITADTIREMVSTGRPLTVDQRKSIATMLANKDTYMSRAYAAFQGAKGRKWAETRWNNFYKNLGKDAATIKDDKKRLDVLEVRGAIKAIVDGLRVPDETALQDMPMDKLVSLAERHNIYESQLVFDRADPDAPWLKREELIAKLAEVKAAYPAGRLEDMAMDTAAELLGLGDRASNYAKQMSQLARDPGTLKKREHVPLEIRRLLGQIDAAPGAVLATLSNQAALRARAKVISEIVNDPNGDIAITQDDYYNLGRTTTKDRLNPRAAPTRSDYVHVTGDSWGALKGMYVRKEAYSRMEEAVTAFHTWGEAMRLVAVDPKIALGKGAGALAKAGGAVNRWTKIPTVVYNPVNYFAQYMGSYLNMVGAGHLSGSAWVKGKAAAFDYIRGTAKTITTPRLSEVMRHMNLESADIAEIQKILGTKLEDYFDGTRSMQDARLAISKHATGLLGRAHKTQLAFYATADNWSKIANFYHRYEVLSAVNDASGKPKTDEQVRQEAGDDTSYTNISPERAHRLIQTAESAGVTQFAPYFAEVFRTRYTGFALAVKDRMQAERLYKEGHEEAANILARAATARFIGHTAATIGMPLVGTVKIASRLAALGVPAAMATAIANGVTAFGADDEENKLKRRLMPEALRFQELISLGKDSRGYPIVWGSSQKIDPSGPMTDLLRIMAYADNDRTAAKALENYAYDNLLIVPQIWKDVYRGIVGDKIPESDIGKALDTVGMKSDFVKATGASPQQVDRYLNVLDNFIPGMLRAYKAQYSPEDLQADAGTKKWANALNLMGFRFETFNPTVALKDYYRVSSEDKRSNSSKVNADLLNISQPDEATIISATERFFKSELSRQVEDYQNVKALKAHGFTDEQAVQLMKDGGYAEKDAKTLVEGVAVVSLSIKGLLEYANNSSAYMAEADKKERKTRVAQVANQIISMKDKLAELGIEVDESGIPKEWKE